MLKKFTIETEKENFYNITSRVRSAVAESGVENGICVVFCPHTTAGITINEMRILMWCMIFYTDLTRLFPTEGSSGILGEFQCAS